MSTQRKPSHQVLQKLVDAARALRDDLDAYIAAHADDFAQPDSKSALIHAKANIAHAAISISGVIDNEDGTNQCSHWKTTAIALARAQAPQVGTMQRTLTDGDGNIIEQSTTHHPLVNNGVTIVAQAIEPRAPDRDKGEFICADCKEFKERGDFGVVLPWQRGFLCDDCDRKRDEEGEE